MIIFVVAFVVANLSSTSHVALNNYVMSPVGCFVEKAQLNHVLNFLFVQLFAQLFVQLD